MQLAYCDVNHCFCTININEFQLSYDKFSLAFRFLLYAIVCCVENESVRIGRTEQNTLPSQIAQLYWFVWTGIVGA